MGLLSFWKKKDIDTLPRIDAPPGTSGPSADAGGMLPDLPSIDGATSGANAQNAGQLPLLDEQSDNKSLSVNMPTLDFSMPPMDDDMRPVAAQAQPEESLEPPTPATPEEAPVQEQTLNSAIDPEDLNRLFINDDSWKEPDVEHFDPYGEEKIDEPQAQDFGVQELPAFEEQNPNIDFKPKPLVADAPISEPSEPFTERTSTQSPVELFIRGRAYSRVFVELEQMNKILSVIESKANNYEELLKKEEPLMLTAKEQAEYLYRRINAIDKKVFVQ